MHWNLAGTLKVYFQCISILEFIKLFYLLSHIVFNKEVQGWGTEREFHPSGLRSGGN